MKSGTSLIFILDSSYDLKCVYHILKLAMYLIYFSAFSSILLVSRLFIHYYSSVLITTALYYVSLSSWPIVLITLLSLLEIS